MYENKSPWSPGLLTQTLRAWTCRPLCNLLLPNSSKENVMKLSTLMTAALLTAGLAASASAQTLKKVADSNKITVSYREASVPFSYLIGSSKAVGFSVELSEAIIDDVRKKLKKPTLEVAHMAVTSQNRIPLLVNGTYDLECG